MFPVIDLTYVVKQIRTEILFCHELKCTALNNFKTPVMKKVSFQ